MKIKNISYPTPLSEIKDITNDNIDVFVELENGEHYTFVVTTPLSIADYMDRADMGYLEAGPFDIVVSKITEENIEKVLNNYLENEGYWFKLCYLAGLAEGTFDIKVLDEMIKEYQ